MFPYRILAVTVAVLATFATVQAAAVPDAKAVEVHADDAIPSQYNVHVMNCVLTSNTDIV